MKKFILTLLLTISVFASYAQLPEPNVIIKTASAKKFFTQITDLTKKIYPDPKLELQLNFALMSFGYPNFKGISETDSLILCVFDIQTTPIYMLCVKAQKDAEILAALKNMPFDVFEFDKWSVISFKNTKKDLSDFAKSAFQKISNKTNNLLEIQLDKTAINLYLSNYVNSNDIQSATLKLKTAKGYIDISTSLYAKKDSNLCKIVDSVEREKHILEAKFVPQDANLTILSKISIPEHIASFDDKFINQLFPKEFIENFKSLQDKNISTFTTTTNFDKILSYTTVTKSELTEEKLENFAKNNAEISLNAKGENIKITNSIFNVFAIKCLRTSYSNLPDSSNYLTVYKGFSIASNKKNYITEAINKIENDMFVKSYPLKKYENINADIIAILNNKSFLNSLLNRINLKMNDDIQLQDTVALINIGLGAIKIDLSINIDSLNCFSDIYRSCNSK